MISGWITDEIDNLCNVEYGTRVVQKNDGGTIYPVYGGGGATFFMDTYNREDRLTIARFAMSAKCTRFVKGKFFLNDSGLTLSPKNKSQIEQDFLNYQCLALNDVFYSLAKGSAQKNLDVPAFRKLKLNIPTDINLQRKIVAKLDAIFAEIDKVTAAAEDNVKNAEALFQSYLTQVFDYCSEDWTELQIKELGKVVTGNTPKTSESENYGDYISFVKPGDFNGDGTIDLEKQKLSQIGMSVSRVVKEKSALMVCIGATIGKCGFVDVDVVTNQQINSVTPNSDFSHKFIYLQMLTNTFQRKILDSSGQATLPIINKSKWESLTLKFPSLSKQIQIVDKFEQLRFETDKLKNSQNMKIKNVNLLKQSILRQAFSGELIKE